jgi:hypothetical protein
MIEDLGNPAEPGSALRGARQDRRRPFASLSAFNAATRMTPANRTIGSPRVNVDGDERGAQRSSGKRSGPRKIFGLIEGGGERPCANVSGSQITLHSLP